MGGAEEFKYAQMVYLSFVVDSLRLNMGFSYFLFKVSFIVYEKSSLHQIIYTSLYLVVVAWCPTLMSTILIFSPPSRILVLFPRLSTSF